MTEMLVVITITTDSSPKARTMQLVFIQEMRMPFMVLLLMVEDPNTFALYAKCLVIQLKGVSKCMDHIMVRDEGFRARS